MQNNPSQRIAPAGEPDTPRPQQSQTDEAESTRHRQGASGNSYRELIRAREEHGNRVAGPQELLLAALIRAEQRVLGRPVEVLELSGDFGSHAASVAALEHVRYQGQDVSGVVGVPDALAALGGRPLDVVLTVSVLSHLPPERLPALLETLGKLVRPGGLLCLVESPLVPFGVRENGPGQGSWLHPYADLVPDGWDLHYGSGLLDSHDVYVFKRNQVTGRRYFRLASVEQPRDEGQPVTLDALHLQSLPRLRAWTEQVGQAPRDGGSEAESRVAELSQRLDVEVQRSTRRQRLLALSDDLAQLRAEKAETPKSKPAPSHPSESKPVPEAVVIDAPLDTAWAHVDARFDRVLHIFHQEWYGIRAAAGYTPGHKLGITADRPLSAADHRRIVETCETFGIRSVVFQGFSNNALEVVHLLRRVFGSSIKLFNVWHGSTSQFHFEFELETFTRLLALKAGGALDGVACVKPEMHHVSPHIYQGLLLNLPPRVEAAHQRHRAPPTRTAFIPTPNNWWKNFYSNVLVAASVPGIERVFVTSPFTARPEFPLRSPVISVGHLKRAELFRVIRDSDVLLNVTLVECQPMTALEGLTHGVACLTGPLTLGPLDEHPLQKLVQVPGTGSLGLMRSALARVLELRERSTEEYAQMLEDYTRTLCAEALNRYLEFTQS
ncbi:methyltransferase type 11 [Pyxidicoccus parkwayensis]|uniref:Methyltransferase type 11 n=1 Tax=Pyxidicoccus parkwayensis TaxID=2813578 RepID=A0ABX7PC87_9BACT|nr:methyltransferase type 11 [Pyxidicoccus parkwaysis]QSQ28042.1 methyltransferase type 11 [Pyxidicoccus parkwaysis]